MSGTAYSSSARKESYDWTEGSEKLELQKIWNKKIDKITVIYPKLQ
jgi:hypothetical protein